jgi:CubicO group peptidase (beta-lactamase class C family)
MRLHPAIMVLVSLLVLLTTQPALAQSDAVLARTDAFMEAHYGGTEAGAAIMILDGDDAWLAGYGMANIEWQQPVTAQTAFRLGSISKPITALAVLQLAEAGHINLDQAIGELVPALPPQLARPTVRDALGHMSGLPDHFALPQIPQIMRNPIAPDDIIALMADAELQFEPGTRWAYSNFNYVVLAAIIAAVNPDGLSYQAYLTQALFTPAGMTDAHYDRQAAIIPRRAAGYDHDGRNPINTITAETSLAHGAGSLIASARDMLALTRALRSNRLVSATTLQTAWQSRLTPEGGETGYGLGFNVGEFLGERAVWHTGSINGFQSVWIMLPDSDRAIAILSNGYYRPNVTTTARRILADMAGRPVPAFEPHALDEAAWLPAQGRYRLENGDLLQLHVQDGVRYNINGGRWHELTWGGGRLFYRPDSLAHLRLAPQAGGADAALILVGPLLEQQSGHFEPGELDGVRVSIPLDPDEAADLIGRWLMPSGDAFTIARSDDGLTLQLPGQPPARIYREAPGEYFQRAAPITLSVTAPGETIRVNLYGNGFDLQRAP